MLYRILTDSDDLYDTALDYLTQYCEEQIQGASRHGRVLAAEDLPEEAVHQLKRLGAQVVEEYQYALD